MSESESRAESTDPEADGGNATPLDRSQSAEQLAALGAPDSNSASADPAPSRKRRRRRRKRKGAAQQEGTSAPPTGTAQPLDTQPLDTQPLDTQPLDIRASAAPPAPEKPPSAPATDGPTVDPAKDSPAGATAEPAAAAESSAPPTPPEVIDDPNAPLHEREVARFQRCVEFVQQHAEALPFAEPPEAQTAPTRDQLRALDEMLEARLTSSGFRQSPKRAELTHEAFVASPTLGLLCVRLQALIEGGEADRTGLPDLELVRRLDVAKDGVQQLNQLLTLLGQAVRRPQHIEWLLAAVENRELKRALEDARRVLPEPWAGLYPQARVLQAVIVRGQTNQWGARQLHSAVRTLLRSGARSFDGRPAQIRERLVACGVRLRLGGTDRESLNQQLNSLATEECFLGLSLDQVGVWLTERQEKPARARLAELSERFPENPTIQQRQKALDGPRYGNAALLKSRVKPPVSLEHALRPGVLLTEQCDVWLRVGGVDDSSLFLQQTEMHRRIEIPGVTSLREAGLTNGRRPYIAYERKGENGRYALQPPRGLNREEALAFARQLLKLAYALARCTVLLPDADLGRLELDSRKELWLVETWGATVVAPEVALEGMLGVLRQWQILLLGDSPLFALSAELRDNLEHAGDFATVRATLDALSRSRSWEA